MKRIYLLMALFVLGTSSAFAQRVCDLQVTMASPTSSTVLNPGNSSFNLDVIIKNNGPDSLKGSTVTDSMRWYATIQGSLINFTIGSQSGTNWIRWNKGLKTGDTTHITFNGLAFSGYSATADSMRTMCFYAFPKGKTGDTIMDPNTANNNNCVSFMFKKTAFPSNVTTATRNGVNDVTLYPNPVTTTANFSFETVVNAEVVVKVLDLNGRIVIEENKGEMTAGKHSIQVNTAALTNGNYIYQVFVGNNVTLGKLTIEK